MNETKGLGAVRRGLRSAVARWGLGCALALLAPTAALAELTLAVHPVLPTEKTQAEFQPMARYLSAATGQPVKLVTTENFLSHWQMMKRGEYDLILDGPHFTDYRIKEMGYEVLAKFPEVVSYTLVANEDLFVLEPRELIGHSIATTPSPALGALRLAELFPNPLRQPNIVEADDSQAAAERTLEGRADAAIVPTPLLNRYPALVPVVTTAQVPAPAVSASESVPAQVRQTIKQALLQAEQNEAGRKMLEAINIDRFEDTNAAEYDGYAKLLQGVWGY